MVNDRELEREEIGGREPMGDPAEVEPVTREGADVVEPETDDDELTEETGSERLRE